MPTPFTIASLAKAADVHVETVRYYQRRGLMAEPVRNRGAIRRYSEGDAERLRFIKRAQAVGFTLDEVANLLALRSQVSCSETRAVAAAKLAVVEERLVELATLRNELASWIADCDANHATECCPVIEHLDAKA
jgi:MerR family transcriptional regulator, mercuric resistance operon regulatory protein